MITDLGEALLKMKVTAERTAVMINQMLGMHQGIKLNHSGYAWHCAEQPAPDVWFGAPVLGSKCLGPWEISPGYVRLHTADGTWIWRLIGETSARLDVTGASPAVTFHRGIWPD